jgi:hypothetical protein
MLRKAVIESAATWVQRTRVQWRSGQMYLQLPERTSTVPLSDVHKKWDRHEQKKTRGAKVGRVRRKPTEQAKKQESIETKQKILDIYASSEYRPPICYQPVQLEFPHAYEADYGERNLGTLFYIRFPGMDLPHYCFWTRPYEWSDPTVPNPDWASVKMQDEQLEQEELLKQERALAEQQTILYVRPPQAEDALRPYALSTTQIRVKRISKTKNCSVSKKKLTKHGAYENAVVKAETQLYTDGLYSVLKAYRQQWLKDGKQHHWSYLIDQFPHVFPSGQLPRGPPVQQNSLSIPRSIAEKIASVECPRQDRPLSPILGDEPWTRDDDEFWDVMATPKSMSEADTQRQLLRSDGSLQLDEESMQQVEERGSQRLVSGELHSWLSDLSPSFIPPTAHMPVSPIFKRIRRQERQAWEEFFQLSEEEEARVKKGAHNPSITTTGPPVAPLITQIESMPVEELKWQLHSLIQERRNSGICRVCLEPLVGDETTKRRHYQDHHDEADVQCPFCGMEWTGLNSQVCCYFSFCMSKDSYGDIILTMIQQKASHIFSHDFDDSLRRRRSSSQPIYFSIPTPQKICSTQAPQSSLNLQSRRSSKVQFSPQTVGKRIAYNDFNDTALDADIDSVPPIQTPRKSNLKAPLRIDTSIKGNSNVRGKLKGNSTVIAKISGNKRNNNPVADYSPSTSSDHVSSPEYHLVRRYAKDHPDAAWDPRRHSSSGSSHIASPHLPLPHVLKHGSRHDPEATYNPRKWSTSSYESSEHKIIKRGTRKKKTGAKQTEVQGYQPARRSKRNEIRQPKREPGDSTAPSPKKSSNPPECRADHPKGKGKAINPSYDNITILSPNSLSRPHLGDTGERNLSTSSAVQKRRLVSKFPQATKKRKLSKKSSKVLERRGSDSQGTWGEEDYIELPSASADDTGPNEWEDMLTGNPFALLPEIGKPGSKSKTKSKPRKVKSSGERPKVKKKTKAKKSTAKEAALATSHAKCDTELQPKPEREYKKRTLSGRPIVEPLVFAPAKKFGKSVRKRGSSASGPAIENGDGANKLMGNVNPSIESPKKEQQMARGRKLSIPASLTSSTSHNSSTSTARTTAESPSSAKSLLLGVKHVNDPKYHVKRPSYDIPFSDTRQIVPPNTPAYLNAKGGCKMSIPIPSKDLDSRGDMFSGDQLDVGALSAEIGKVKTTRGGLVRELPQAVTESVTSKAKARARSVARESGATQEIRTEKSASKQTKGARKKRSSGKAVSGTEGNIENSIEKAATGRVEKETKTTERTASGQKVERAVGPTSKKAAKGREKQTADRLANHIAGIRVSTRLSNRKTQATSKAKATPAKTTPTSGSTSTSTARVAKSATKVNAQTAVPQTKAA